MKRIISVIMIVICASFAVLARETVTRDIKVLPVKAQNTLKSQFRKAQVNRIKVERTIRGTKEYEVILDNGTEIEFLGNGDWKEIDCGHQAVPQYFIIPSIQTYLRKNHNKQKVVKIEKDQKGYEIELNDGREIKFNRGGQFLRYD